MSQSNRLKSGMLWMDASDQPLEARIKRGIEYFERKYKQTPTWVHVNSEEKDVPKRVRGANVIVDKKILRYHLWIGEYTPKHEEDDSDVGDKPNV